jgi:hypothetical protein
VLIQSTIKAMKPGKSHAEPVSASLSRNHEILKQVQDDIKLVFVKVVCEYI